MVSAQGKAVTTSGSLGRGILYAGTERKKLNKYQSTKYKKYTKTKGTKSKKYTHRKINYP